MDIVDADVDVDVLFAGPQQNETTDWNLGLEYNKYLQEVVQILAATCGLTVAPREFYIHFVNTVMELGGYALSAEPCVYAVYAKRGVVRALVAMVVGSHLALLFFFIIAHTFLLFDLLSTNIVVTHTSQVVLFCHAFITKHRSF